MGEEAVLLIRVNDPIGSDGFYDVRFTTDSTGRAFAHFEDGSTSRRVFVPKGYHALVLVHFLPSAVGSYELKIEAAHSVYSQPPQGGGVCNFEGYDSTSEIWVAEEEGRTAKSGWDKISSFRLVVVGGFIFVLVLGVSLLMLFFKRNPEL